jgi:hypothetical protein
MAALPLLYSTDGTTAHDNRTLLSPLQAAVLGQLQATVHKKMALSNQANVHAACHDHYFY